MAGLEDLSDEELLALASESSSYDSLSDEELLSLAADQPEPSSSLFSDALDLAGRYAAKAGMGILQGGVDIGTGITGAAKGVQDLIASQTQTPEDFLNTYQFPIVGPAIAELGRYLNSSEDPSYLDIANQYAQDTSKLGDRLNASLPEAYGGDLLGGVARGVTSFVPGMMSGGYLPLTATMATLNTGRTYGTEEQQALDRGYSPQEAESLAAEGALGAAPFEIAAAPLQALGLSKGAPLIRRALTGAFGGATGGLAQTLGQIRTEEITGTPLTQYEANELIKNSLIQNTIMGGAMPVVGDLLGKTTPFRDSIVAERATEITDPKALEAIKADIGQAIGTQSPDIEIAQQLPRPDMYQPETLNWIGEGAQKLGVEPPLREVNVIPEPRPPVPSVPEKTITKIDTVATQPKVIEQLDTLPAPRPDAQIVPPDYIDVKPTGEIYLPPSFDEMKTVAKAFDAGEKVPSSQIIELGKKTNYAVSKAQGQEMTNFLAGANKKGETPLGEVVAKPLAVLRELTTLPPTYQDKFGVPVWEASKLKMEEANRTMADVVDIAQPFINLKDSAAVNTYVSQINDFFYNMQKEGLPPPAFDDAFIEKLHLDPQGKSAIKALKQTTDYAADLIGKQLKQELPPERHADIDSYVSNLKQGIYIPKIRSEGKWAVIGVDEKGETTYFTKTKTRAEAVALQQKLGNEGVPVRVEVANQKDPTLAPFSSGGLDTLSVKGNGDILTGFQKHLAESKNVPGYDPDIQSSLVEYIKSLSNWVGNRESKRAFTQLKSSLPENSGAWNEISKIEQRLLEENNPFISQVTAFNNVMNLAGVTSSGLVNAYQTATATLPHIASELTEIHGARGLAKVPLTMAKAIKQAGDYTFGGKGLDAETRAFLDDASRSGVFEATGAEQLTKAQQRLENQNPVVQFAMNTFTAPEKANRIIAYLAALDIGRQRGLKGAELQGYADKFVATTNADNSQAGRSRMLSGMLRIPTQYWGYQANMLKFLKDKAIGSVSGTNKAGNAAALTMSLIAQVGLGGVMSLPFVKLGGRVAQTVTGKDDSELIREWFGEGENSTAVAYGLPTKYGINMSGAVSLGDYNVRLDEDPLTQAGRTLLGPLGGPVTQAYKAATEYLPQGEYWMAAENVLPRSVRGMSKAMRTATQGRLEGSKGETLIDNATPLDVTALGLGFTPQTLATSNELKGKNYRMQKSFDPGIEYNSKIAKALSRSDKPGAIAALKEVEQYNLENPDKPIELDESVIKRALALKLRLPFVPDIVGPKSKRYDKTMEIIKEGMAARQKPSS